MPNGRSDDYGPTWGLDPITGVVIGTPTFVIYADLSQPFELPPGFDWAGPPPVFGVDYGVPPFASTDTEDPTNVEVTPRVPVVTDSDIDAVRGAGPPVQFDPGPPVQFDPGPPVNSGPESAGELVPLAGLPPLPTGPWPFRLPAPTPPRRQSGLIDTRRGQRSTSLPLPDALRLPGFGVGAQVGSALGQILRRVIPKIIPKKAPPIRRAPPQPLPRIPTRPRPTRPTPRKPPPLPKTPTPLPKILEPYPLPTPPTDRPGNLPDEMPWPNFPPRKATPRPRAPEIPRPRAPSVPRPRIDFPPFPAPDVQLPPIPRPIPRVPTPARPPKRQPKPTPRKANPWPNLPPIVPWPFSPRRSPVSPSPSSPPDVVVTPLPEPFAPPLPFSPPMPGPLPLPSPLPPSAAGPLPAPAPLTPLQPTVLPFASPQTARDRCDCRQRKHSKDPSDKVANVKTYRRRMSRWSLKNLNRGRKRGK